MSYYEPWSPKVGDRVRVRPGAECPVDHIPTLTTGRVVSAVDEDAGPEYVLEEDGDGEMTLEQLQQEARNYRGHWYEVEYDEPVYLPTPRWPIRFGLYAAIELELLTT